MFCRQEHSSLVKMLFLMAYDLYYYLPFKAGNPGNGSYTCVLLLLLLHGIVVVTVTSKIRFK